MYLNFVENELINNTWDAQMSCVYEAIKEKEDRIFLEKMLKYCTTEFEQRIVDRPPMRKHLVYRIEQAYS